MKTNLGKNKGITLIALVITIIILLILAGVSIAMLTGNNGILSQASKAKNETELASAREQLGLILTDVKMGAYENGEEPKITEDNKNDILDYISGQDNVESVTGTDDGISVTIDGEDFLVDNNLNIKDMTQGVITSNIQVDIVEGAKIQFSSANPEEFAKKEEYEMSKKIASTEGVKVASATNSIITIHMPNEETATLDLSDENAVVEYWAYKSKEYSFTVEDQEGNQEVLKVNVDIPYTDEGYFTYNDYYKKYELKESSSYYKTSYNKNEKKGQDYPISVINISPSIDFTSSDKILAINGITTVIFSEKQTTITTMIYSGTPGDDIKTIYIPESVTSIGLGAFAGLTDSTTIYFEASEPLDTWNKDWNTGCNAKMLWNK